MSVESAGALAAVQCQIGGLTFDYEHAGVTTWPREAASPPKSHMVGKPRPALASSMKGPRARVRMASDDGTFLRSDHGLAAPAPHGAAHPAPAPRSAEPVGAHAPDVHPQPPSAMQTILAAVQSRHGHARRAAPKRATSLSHCIPQALGSQRAAFIEEQLRLHSALAALQLHQEALRQAVLKRLAAPPASGAPGSDPAAAPQGSSRPQDRQGKAASPPPGWPSSAPGEGSAAPGAPARHALGSGPSLTGLVWGGPGPEVPRHAVCSGPSLTTIILPAANQQQAATASSPLPSVGAGASMLASPSSPHDLAGSPPSLTFPCGVSLSPDRPAARLLRSTLSLAERTLTTVPGQVVQSEPLVSRPPLGPKPHRVSTPSLLDGEILVAAEPVPGRPASGRGRSERLSPEPRDAQPPATWTSRQLAATYHAGALPSWSASLPSSPAHRGGDAGSPPAARPPVRQFLRPGGRPASIDGGVGSADAPPQPSPRERPLRRRHATVSWSGSEIEIEPASSDCSPSGQPQGGSGRLSSSDARSPALPGIPAARHRSPSPESQSPQARGQQASPTGAATGLHGLLSSLKQGLGGSGAAAGGGGSRQLHKYKSVNSAAGAKLLPKLSTSSPDVKRPLMRGSVAEALGPEAGAGVLAQRVELEASRVSHCELMLGMYMNRSNAAWAESQGGWAPAQAVEQQELQDGEDVHVYKAELIRKLRMGQIVFQLFAAEDELPLPAGGSLDLWTADPWALVAAARQGSMPISGERMEGLSMGGRALTQLRMAVEEVAGPEAAAALSVVLHLHEGQREAVLKDLCNRRHYGLRAENLFVTVQQRRPAYRYDSTGNQFVPADADASGKLALFSMGPGFGMLQLGWVGDAFTLSDSGRCTPLKEPLLEHLQRRNVEWLISRRSSDLALYSADGALDVASLAQVLQLRQHARARLVCQVMAAPSMNTIRHTDSLILSRKSSEAILTSPLKPPSQAQPVHELRCCECSSSVMVEALGQVKAEAGGELLAGLHRYAFHFPTLVKMLANPKVFRPKLALEGSAVRVSLELSDLTTNPDSKCLATLAPAGRTVLLKTAKELEDLVPALQRQDRSPAFSKLAGSPGPDVRRFS